MLLGSADLSYEQICPGGFSGDVLLKANGRSTKAALRVSFKVLHIGVELEMDTADAREADRIQADILRMEQDILAKKSKLKHLKVEADASQVPLPIAPPELVPGSGTTLPWDTMPDETKQVVKAIIPSALDPLTMQLRRNALRLFLEGSCGNLSVAIEEITGCPLRRSKASAHCHYVDEGVKLPGLAEFRSVLEEMGYKAPHGEPHW